MYQQAGAFDRPNGADRLGIVNRGIANNQGRTAVMRPRLFSGILPADYTRICAAARSREFARGEVLYIEGDTVQQVLLLTLGSAKINKLGMSGSEVILRFGVPGDVLGVAGLFSTGKHCTTAQAFRPCRALVWDVAAFKALVDRFPVLHQNMARILTEDLLELEDRFREVATERVGPRVARQVLRLMEKIGRPVKGEVEIGISREELAQMTGTTLFTVSRLFSAWEVRGIVTARRESVAICSVEILRAVARGDESLCSEEPAPVRKSLSRSALSATG